MITIIGVLKTLSFLLGLVLIVNLFKKNSEFNKKDNDIKY